MNDQLTTRLSRELHDQVDDLHGAPLTLESVRGRAHAIRRTRRMLVAGAAAVAVAAVVVPITLLGDTTGRSDRGPQIAETPTSGVAPTPRADGTFPLTLDVPEGPVPVSGYLSADQHYVAPDGVHDLPGAFTQLTPYDGGWVGIRFSRQSPTAVEVVVLDEDLEEVSASPGGPGLAVSSDGSHVSWIDVTGGGDTGTLVNAPVDGTRPSYAPVPSDSQVEGFLGNDLVAVSSFDGTTGETSYTQVAADEGLASRAGSAAASLAGYQSVGGVSDAAGLVAGQTVYRGDSTCSEVRRTDDPPGSVVYETCDHQLGGFSPDGQLLIGFASYFDLGSPTLAILDAATGEPVVEWTSSRQLQDAAIVHSAAWEDGDTVVAVVEQGAEQQVLRFEVDGSVTRSGEPQRARMSIEYFLPGDIYGQ